MEAPENRKKNEKEAIAKAKKLITKIKNAFPNNRFEEGYEERYGSGGSHMSEYVIKVYY